MPDRHIGRERALARLGLPPLGVGVPTHREDLAVKADVAGEVMAVVQTAMLADMPYTGLRDAILAHPTMAEGLGGLFSNVPYG